MAENTSIGTKPVRFCDKNRFSWPALRLMKHRTQLELGKQISYPAFRGLCIDRLPFFRRKIYNFPFFFKAQAQEFRVCQEQWHPCHFFRELQLCVIAVQLWRLLPMAPLIAADRSSAGSSLRQGNQSRCFSG